MIDQIADQKQNKLSVQQPVMSDLDQHGASIEFSDQITGIEEEANGQISRLRITEDDKLASRVRKKIEAHGIFI